jgi:hypothetical protein
MDFLYKVSLETLLEQLGYHQNITIVFYSLPLFIIVWLMLRQAENKEIKISHMFVFFVSAMFMIFFNTQIFNPELECVGSKTLEFKREYGEIKAFTSRYIVLSNSKSGLKLINPKTNQIKFKSNSDQFASCTDKEREILERIKTFKAGKVTEISTTKEFK